MCISAAAATCAEAEAEPVPLQRIGMHLWLVAAARGEPDAANRGLTAQAVLALDGDRLWLVGSGPTPAFGAALAGAAMRATGQAVSDVVNSRAAPELAMGNAAFIAARVWALPDVIGAMRRRCGECLRRLKARLGAAGSSLQPDRVRVPEQPVLEAAPLGPFDVLALERRPGERVLLLRHRDDGVVIAQGLLWAGDLPDLRDTDSATMLSSLRALRAFAAGATVVGEQGGVVLPTAIDAHIAYLEALRAAVARSIERGDLPGTPAAAAALPAFAALPGYQSWHVLNVQRVWRELEPMIFR